LSTFTRPRDRRGAADPERSDKTEPAKEILVSQRLARVLLHVAWIVVTTASGVALSSTVQQASALDLPLPTLPLPTVPTVPTVTVPEVTTTPPTTTSQSVPTTTTTATTSTAPSTTTVTATVTTTAEPQDQPSSTTPSAGTTPATTTATTAPTTTPVAAPAVAGARRLAVGAVSVPVSSVRAPARLRILYSYAPHVLRQRGQRISVATRVVDTRGYVVRGARVTVTTSVGKHGTKLSAVDGLAMFGVPAALRPRDRGTLLLSVRAVDPAAPAAATAALRIRIPIRTTR
jgi:hypothetical protein